MEIEEFGVIFFFDNKGKKGFKGKKEKKNKNKKGPFFVCGMKWKRNSF